MEVKTINYVVKGRIVLYDDDTHKVLNEVFTASFPFTDFDVAHKRSVEILHHLNNLFPRSYFVSVSIDMDSDDLPF